MFLILYKCYCLLKTFWLYIFQCEKLENKATNVLATGYRVGFRNLTSKTIPRPLAATSP